MKYTALEITIIIIISIIAIIAGFSIVICIELGYISRKNINKVANKLDKFDSTSSYYICGFKIFSIAIISMIIIFLINDVNFSSSTLRIISLILNTTKDTGILILLALLLIRNIFKKDIKKYCLNPKFKDNPKQFKTYYTLAIIVACIFFGIILYLSDDSPDINGIIIISGTWIANILGIWLPMSFEFDTEATVVNDINTSIKKPKPLNKIKTFFKLNKHSIISILIACLIMFVLICGCKAITLPVCTFAISIGCFGIGVILSFEYLEHFYKCPPENISNLILLNAINAMNKKHKVHKRYQSIEYELVEKSNEPYLVIIGGNEIQLKAFEYNEVHKDLTNFINKKNNDTKQQN